MQDLKLTLIQTRLSWEDPEGNRKILDDKISAIREETDIIVLPEMFTTGFTVDPGKYAENPKGKSVGWLAGKASEKDCALVGSIITEENGRYFNRLYWMLPDGSYQYYDKRHLFRMGEEDLRFSQGRERLIVNYKGWNIFPLICYDLRFPVWSKNRYSEGKYEYDLIIYIANWPAVRSFAWKSLLVGRAIENISFVAGINRVGKDGKDIDYTGDSMVLFPDGRALFAAPPDSEITLTLDLSYEMLEKARNNFQVGPDWDHFVIED